MIDYKFKSDVLKTGICKKIKYIDYQDYIKYSEGIINRASDDLYVSLVMQYGGMFIKEARKINNASFKRVNRLRNRIKKYLGLGQCIFVTLTFTDDVLKSTNFETRRKYVSRYLKSVCNQYVANVDYGVDDRYTHREHYHALVVSDFISQKEWTDNYGFVWTERIHKTDDKILALYVSKLCNHAIKDSTKRNCYIYSRG